MRHMAPEAIRHKHFSEASDVWSCGVLMYEVLRDGATPYHMHGLQGVERAVCDEGLRLPEAAWVSPRGVGDSDAVL